MPSYMTITANWLTERLRLNGYSFAIKEVEVADVRTTNNSTIYFLRAYLITSREAAPLRFFLKVPSPEFIGKDKEIVFYRDIVPSIQEKRADSPFVHCFDLDYDPESGHSHLLMEDLSDTHFTFSGTENPTQQHYEQIIDGFAHLHARWWEHPQLDERIGMGLTAEMIAAAEHQVQVKFSEMIAVLADRITVEQRSYLGHIAAGWPVRRRERVINGQGVTLVHRDPHLYNFLYPRQSGTVKIIDWQSWRVDTGTDDLAYMMACHWDMSQREELELALLRRYHSALVEFGVSDYGWSDCWYDYQASIIRCLFFLMNAWSPTQWEATWSRIERGLLAFKQLNCIEILA